MRRRARGVAALQVVGAPQNLHRPKGLSNGMRGSRIFQRNSDAGSGAASGYSTVKIGVTGSALLAVVAAAVWYIWPAGHDTRRAPSSSSPHSATNTEPPGSASAMQGVALGVTAHPIGTYISEVHRSPAIIDTFSSWQTSNGSDNLFPKATVDATTAMAAVPEITWEPGESKADNSAATAVKQQNANLASIISGTHDAYIRQWARDAKVDGRPIYLRLMHEMNGDYYPWAYQVFNQSPAQFVQAWQHVVNIFHQASVTNVQFIWCESTKAADKGGAPPLSSFYPGDAYVSWVSMDGYNRNPDHPRSFQQVFGKDYQALVGISKRPVMIAEMGTVEESSGPNAKAAWITDAFLTAIPHNFPHIKAVLYFDSKGHNYTYPLDSSPAALAAYNEVVSNPYYQAKAPTAPLAF